VERQAISPHSGYFIHFEQTTYNFSLKNLVSGRFGHLIYDFKRQLLPMLALMLNLMVIHPHCVYSITRII